MIDSNKFNVVLLSLWYRALYLAAIHMQDNSVSAWLFHSLLFLNEAGGDVVKLSSNCQYKLWEKIEGAGLVGVMRVSP